MGVLIKLGGIVTPSPEEMGLTPEEMGIDPEEMKVNPCIEQELSPEEKSEIDKFIESRIPEYAELYTNEDLELDNIVDFDDVDDLIVEIREVNIEGINEMNRDILLAKLKRAHEWAKAQSIKEQLSTEATDARGEKIRESLTAETPEKEELSENEKKERAQEISVDALATSKEPELKKQSDAGRAAFIDRIIQEFDQRGWVLPPNYFYLDESMDDDGKLTEHDKERQALIKRTRDAVKDEFMPDFI